VLFTFPSRYLCTIGRRGVFSLGSWSTQIPTGFHVSRGTREYCKGVTKPFAYGAFTLYGGSFQKPSARLVISNSPIRPQPNPATSLNPDRATLAGYHTRSVWARPRSLAPLRAYGFSTGWFGHPGLNARLTAPPGISQSSHALLRLLAPRHPPHASLLSQFQTPTTPRRVVGFFGFGCPSGFRPPD